LFHDSVGQPGTTAGMPASQAAPGCGRRPLSDAAMRGIMSRKLRVARGASAAARKDGWMDIAGPVDEHFGPAAYRQAFERGTDGPRVIMVGIDGSSTSMHAAAYACGMARRQRCRLVVVFVAEPASFGTSVSAIAVAALARTYDELAGQLRDEIRRTAEEHCVPTTFLLRRGDPFALLRDLADQIKADMLVVGASAQAGHRFVGSIATRLVKLGRWPVVVVP
jgi:nucleotide-binding universal stress UspA family protein